MYLYGKVNPRRDSAVRGCREKLRCPSEAGCNFGPTA